MKYLDTIHFGKERLHIRSLLPDAGIGSAIEEIRNGLNARDKYIHSKFFYNHRGTGLYQQITQLEEYYPTRTEKTILGRIAPGLMRVHRDYDLIELGPGDFSKISFFLEAAKTQRILHYFPLDISETAIRKLSEILVSRFPLLTIEAWIMDFTSQFGMLRREQPALICFFGSTIGNFSMDQARDFLRKLSLNMKTGDRLLLGMDLEKPLDVLHAAYNDSLGVTAAFNLNILSSVNEILDSDFLEEDFLHVALYNRKKSRIEMHLEAIRDVQVNSPYLNKPVLIRKGERIHTENSHKYSQKHIHDFSRCSRPLPHSIIIKRLNIHQVHTDDRQWFAVVEFIKP